MSAVLITIGLACIVLAGAIHVLIFLLESVLWRPRRTWRQFGIRTEEEAEVVRPWALNQGFYNLFLALGAVAGGAVGIAVLGTTHRTGSWVDAGALPLPPAGDPFAWAAALDGWGWVAVFCALCMLGAAIVLIVSSRGKLLRGALIQGLPALVGLALLGVAL